MPCAHPIPAVKRKYGGRVILGAPVRNFVRDGRADEVLAGASLLLPCGSCVGCQLSRARSWAIRCSLELQQHLSASFVTLTYEDRYLPPTLQRQHLSAWVKRLRSRLDHPFRFFGCGEYGEKRGRPHYHAILFSASVDEVMFHRSAWRFGFVSADSVNPARISYVAGYCAKKVGPQAAEAEAVDYATGELYTFQPPFVQMSRGGRLRDGRRAFGIGGHVREHWRSWRSFALHSGAQVPVPRYLHASWREHASESEKADLERERLESRMALTIRELDASEAIAKARVRSQSERSKL